MNVAIRDVLRVPKVPPGEYVVGFRWDCETSSREHSSLVFRLFNPGLTLQSSRRPLLSHPLDWIIFRSPHSSPTVYGLMSQRPIFLCAEVWSTCADISIVARGGSAEVAETALSA